MVALAKMQWQETEAYRHSQPFNPSYERYRQYEQIGCYFEATVRDVAKMVGFSGIYLCPSMHSQCLIATEDSLFLHPDYRKGWTAARFIKFLENECRKRGAVEVSITSKRNGVGKLLERLDFELVGYHYSKPLVSAIGSDTALTSVKEDAAHVLK